MSAATKTEALKKLDAFVVKIGYPDKWKDYSALDISRDSYVQNVLDARDVGLQVQREQVRQADRPRRVGHDAAHGERVLQPAA